MRLSRRAQAGIDYFVVIAMLLVLLSPFWIYLYDNLNRSQDDLRIAYAKTATSRIKEAADLVYSQGAPAQATIQVYLPSSIDSTNVTTNTLEMKMRVAGGTSDVVSTTRAAQLQGSLPATEGYHSIIVKAMDGYVNITE